MIFTSEKLILIRSGETLEKDREKLSKPTATSVQL